MINKLNQNFVAFFGVASRAKNQPTKQNVLAIIWPLENTSKTKQVIF